MKKTLVVNLFAGPGAGKSTGATYIFSKLKMAGVDAEYVSEFAKDKVWEDNKAIWKNQLYISGKQSFKISRCNGKVDVIVTDSPIALGASYNTSGNPYLSDCLLYEFNQYNNISFLINRVKAYNPNGRNQTEYEAKAKDAEIKNWLEEHSIPFDTVDGNEEGYDEAVEIIKEYLKENKGE